MKFQGFVGPTYSLKSVNVDCQRCVNLYPELIESGTGKEGQVAYLKSTPGLNKLFTVGSGPIRMIHVDDPKIDVNNPANRVFIASGSEMYKATYASGVWTTSKLGDLSTSSGPIKAASSQIDLGVTVFVDGVKNYLFWRYVSGTPTESFNDFSSFGYIGAPKATHVIWVDGYFIFNSGGTSQFYISDWGSLNVSPLSFASAEGDPDNIVAVISNHRDLWLLNERTTEVFSDTGNASFPFERVQGGFIEKGCMAPFSVARIDGVIFWLGQDSSGQGIVYAAQGLTPQRVSTHSIEAKIKTYASPSSATGYAYQSCGHSFYVLNFAEGTWVFDLSTKLWHERAYTDSGTLTRHRADCVAYLPALGIHLAGDFSNNKIYKLDEDYYSDDGDAITRMRIAPHVSNSLNRVFYKALSLDMETGIGLDGGVQGSDPQVMLQYSNDGGHTWSDEAWASAGQKIGGIGDFKKRVIWRRLGMARDRVFKIVITDPVPVTLLGAELDLEGGNS